MPWHLDLAVGVPCQASGRPLDAKAAARAAIDGHEATWLLPNGPIEAGVESEALRPE